MEYSDMSKPFGKIKVIHEFTILYEGWEMDNTGWVVKDQNGDIHLKMTSHESAYYSQNSVAINELKDHICEHKAALEGLEMALALIEASA